MSAWSEIWNGIVAFFNFLLQAFYRFSGNYGLAIIILTALIKIVLIPLTIKQTRSMLAMQKIQPEIKKIQEKYKDDKERLSQEMMKFYKENKINPLGGCLPLLLQIPVFFALFTVLRKYLLTPPALLVGNTYSVFGGIDLMGGAAYALLPVVKKAGFLWMGNLADTTRIADPYFVLVILLAASTWYSQKQVMTDPRQKNMMIIMPIFTAFIGYSLPAGVCVYWVTTNILQILQQWGMELYDKRVKGKGEAKAQYAQKAGRVEKGEQIKKRPAARVAPKPPERGGVGKPATKGQTKKKGSKKVDSGKEKPSAKGAGTAKKAAKTTDSGKPRGTGGSQKKRPKTPPPGSKARSR
ncbi:MAG: membrane protein insertase YidC [Actinobacteria bacterium]|nr:membrane protein insertase YidC [Actinomycetota bacterium]